MRLLPLIIVLCGGSGGAVTWSDDALAAGGATPAPRAFAQRRFDHADHFALPAWDRKLPCAGCHNTAQPDQQPPAGAFVHTRCNAAGCHATDFDAYREDLCLVCHLERSRVPAKAKPMQPFPKEATFYAELSHSAHLTGKAASKLKDKCNDCHSTKEKRPSHAECGRSECHVSGAPAPLASPLAPGAAPGPKDGAAPGPKAGAGHPMSACEKCHRDLVDPAGKPAWTGPRLRLDRCRVTAKFSHAKHEERKSSCGDCHLSVPKATKLGELVATNGGRTMEKACGTCHDGKKAFSVRGSCESCHTHDCVVEGP